MTGGTGSCAGAIRAIERFGAHCLRRPSLPVKADDSRVAPLLADLWCTLDDDGGVGLAAPQIGVNLRVVVVSDPDGKDGQNKLELINPCIISTFGPQVGFEEGCLSFPGIFVTVDRPQGIYLEYQDCTGQTLQLKNNGLLARIIQHELQHLDGILFVDHLPWTRRWPLIPRLGMLMAGTFFSQNRKKGKEAQ